MRSAMKPRFLLLALALSLCGVVAAAQAPAATPPLAAGQAGSAYVPNAACKTCHAEEFTQYQTSPHAKIPLSGVSVSSPAGGERAQPGCQSCHGPGKNHTENPGDPSTIFNFRTVTPAAVIGRCLSCHNTSHEQVNFASSVHARNGLKCTDCHSIHHPETEQVLLKLPQPQLCYSCHQARRADFEMPSHHKVNEGMVQCTDCHNPHGTPLPNQLRASDAADAICYTCHVDKRGPFVYEHEAVKVDGCLTCHNPHGSSNPHLLKVSNVNILCLQCHTASSFSGAPGTPSFHNQTAQYQSCLSCHTQIHGSNFSPVFFY